MQKGNQVLWLLGQLKATRKTYEKQNMIYWNLPSHADHVKDGSVADVVDLIEFFAGEFEFPSWLLVLD